MVSLSDGKKRIYNIMKAKMIFNKQFVEKALPDSIVVHDTFPQRPALSVDSRTIGSEEIFVALRGQQCDGHEFVKDAVARGAVGLIVAKDKRNCLNIFDKSILNRLLVVLVDDTHQALIQLAVVWRTQFENPIIAITGSVGKTTTKELTGQILRAAGKNFLISQGNQNTLIGVALNILRLKSEHEGAVFELGVSKRGEMQRLVEMLRPTSALITNIGHSHMEGIGSLQDIAFEKRDVFKCFAAENIGIINGDQTLLSNVAYPHPMIKFGSKTTNQIQARKIRITSTQINFVLKLYRTKYQITLPQPHAGLIDNVLAAVAACYLLHVPAEVIVQTIQQPLRIANRFEPCRYDSTQSIIINDAYNANPESMKSSLLAFQQMQVAHEKVAVLGDMLELGGNSPFWHRQLGRFMRKVPTIKRVILVGAQMQWMKKTLPTYVTADIVDTWQDAVALVRPHLEQGASVLVKGSHGIGLTQLVETITSK